MIDQQLAAIRGSITKWEAIVSGTGEDEGATNCPCCQMFYLVANQENCTGCPIAEHTGNQYCEGSPYEDWDEYTQVHNTSHIFTDDEEGIINPAGLRYAQAELDFLKMLLDKLEAQR